jgi:hypothetical protein
MLQLIHRATQGHNDMTFVAEVKAYAIAHYETDGWDVVVECYADDEIEIITEGATTAEEAIALMRDDVAPYNEQREAVRAEIF